MSKNKCLKLYWVGNVDIWIFGCMDNEGKGIHRKK